MWFKQLQVFNLTIPFNSAADAIAEKLSKFAFKPCLPSMQTSSGWISPLDEDELPLARGINGCIMLTLQIEEKILPATVVNRFLKEKVREIETKEDRKLYSKEKYRLKDELVMTLLPRAFSKFTQIYAYLDTLNGWLIVNTSNGARLEQFLAFFTKTFGDVTKAFELSKTSAVLTHWLKHQDYPNIFSIEKFCLLQDPNHQQRIIRCQQQDLLASSILTVLQDGFEVAQMALCWQDKINFTIAENFVLRNLQLADDEVIKVNDEAETRQQKFDADFVMMTMMFRDLLKDLLKVFVKVTSTETTNYALVG